MRQAQQQVDEIFAELDELRRKMQQQADFQAINDAKVSARKHMNAAQGGPAPAGGSPEPETLSRPLWPETGWSCLARTAATVVQVNGDGSLVLQAER